MCFYVVKRPEGPCIVCSTKYSANCWYASSIARWGGDDMICAMSDQKYDSIAEIECRFLEIDKEGLIKRLLELGANDLGEKMLEEVIINDKEGHWTTDGKFIRIRTDGEKSSVSYKEHITHSIDGSTEIEIEINDPQKAEMIFEKVGLVPFRRQQKLRHSFVLDGVTFDIDTWPKIPTYVELEGESEQVLRDMAHKIGYDWNYAVFNNAGWIIEQKYNIPVRRMRWFTFDRVEL